MSVAKMTAVASATAGKFCLITHRIFFAVTKVFLIILLFFASKLCTMCKVFVSLIYQNGKAIN